MGKLKTHLGKGFVHGSSGKTLGPQERGREWPEQLERAKCDGMSDLGGESEKKTVWSAKKCWIS